MNYLLKWYFLICISFYSFSLKAQVSQSASFDFLSTPSFSRNIALGGICVSASSTEEVNIFTSNPALLSWYEGSSFSFNYSDMYVGISNMFLSSIIQVKPLGKIGLNLQYLNYGSFVHTDTQGAVMGNFYAPHFAFTLGWAGLNKKNFTFGANLKIAHSQIFQQSNTAIFFDLGTTFIHPKKNFIFGLVVKNIGFSLNSHNNSFSMPLDIQAGISYKPFKMPIKMSITVHHLYVFDIIEKNSSNVSTLPKRENDKFSVFDKLASHFILAAELLLSKNIHLRIGYNYWQRLELKTKYRIGFIGFSFGVLLKIKKIQVEYATRIQNTNRNIHNLSLSFNIKEVMHSWKKK